MFSPITSSPTDKFGTKRSQVQFLSPRLTDTPRRENELRKEFFIGFL